MKCAKDGYAGCVIWIDEGFTMVNMSLGDRNGVGVGIDDAPWLGNPKSEADMIDV